MSYGSNKPRKFIPRNPSKYKGDPNKIVSRSSWERIFMGYLDSSPDVILWASEEICIPYKSPKDGQIHRYFPDFLIKIKNKNGKESTLIVEIKPYIMSVKPVGKVNDRILAEYIINVSKWEAAIKFAKESNAEFKVITEYDLGIKQRRV